MRMKRALALVVILIAVAGVSFLLYERANRPRTDAATGVGDSGPTEAPTGAGGLEPSTFTNDGSQAAIRVAGGFQSEPKRCGCQGEPIRCGSQRNLRPEQRSWSGKGIAKEMGRAVT